MGFNLNKKLCWKSSFLWSFGGNDQRLFQEDADVTQWATVSKGAAASIHLLQVLPDVLCTQTRDYGLKEPPSSQLPAEQGV